MLEQKVAQIFWMVAKIAFFAFSKVTQKFQNIWATF